MTQVQLLIDGNASGYQAHNGDILTASNGMQVQAVYGFMQAVRNLKNENPDANIVVLWDGASWRKGVSATYKESRDPDMSEFDRSKPMDEVTAKRFKAAAEKAASRAAYKLQGPFIERALKLMGVPQITCFNYEADDLAALFTDRYVAKGHPVRLITSDDDWMQLVQNRVIWKCNRPPFLHVSQKDFRLKAKVGDGPEAVRGFTDTSQFVDAKILAGDKGDCVDGIPGFGNKTVGRFFQCFDGIQTFLDTPRATVETVWREKAEKKAPSPLMLLHERGYGKNESDVPELALGRTLVDLRTKNRPAHGSIKTERGSLDPAGLLDLCKQLDLYRLISEMPRFVETFRGE